MKPSLREIDLLAPGMSRTVAAYLKRVGVPGAVVSIVAGDRGYVHPFGVRSLADGVAVDADTSFNIGSCSKAFTSATMAALVGEGRARWDDALSQYVPEFQLHDPAVTAQVTLRDCSGNRLGLPRDGLPEYGLDPSYPPEESFLRLRHTPAAYGLRERCTYVNPGHTAVAVAAGRIGGSGFLEALRTRIAEPLGMSGTSGGAAAAALPSLAAWHVPTTLEGHPRVIDTVYTDQYLGTGGMWVSGRDAVSWLRLHLNRGEVDGRQVIDRKALLETHQPHIPIWPGSPTSFGVGEPECYALGWATTSLEGHPVVAHSGGDLGCGAFTLLLPRERIGVAVYCNMPSLAHRPLAYALAATLLGLKPRDWMVQTAALQGLATAPAPPAPVAAGALDQQVYAGRYHHPGDGDLVVEPVGAGLRWRVVDGYRMSGELEPAGEHVFLLRHPPDWNSALHGATLRFEVDAGRATAALLWPHSERRFSRVEG